MNITYFNLEAIKSRSDIRTQYLKLAKKYHPDVCKTLAPDEANRIMKLINAELEYLDNNYTKFINQDNKEASFKEKSFINLDKFKKALDPVIALQGVNIEICGSWVWVSGYTLPYQKIFNQAGYFWSRSKKAWFYNGQVTKCGFKGHYTMGQIRDMHGSVKVENKEVKYLQAD